VLDDVGVEEDRRRPLRQLSRGTVQRVGLASALVNDPELVILDEPMSGLDPIGRREVRELILRLRDAGRTVLFSSHILSDAELLCSRIGILVRGRLMAAGSMPELASNAGCRDARGWEVVVGALSPGALARISPRALRLTRIAEDRYSFELPADAPVETFMAELAADGARLISLIRLRTTLEDVFMSALASASPEPGTRNPES
jgi:ABC-2 type transport system ATP-binding protein